MAVDGCREQVSAPLPTDGPGGGRAGGGVLRGGRGGGGVVTVVSGLTTPTD